MSQALNLDRVKARLKRMAKEFDGMAAQVGLPKGKYYPNGMSVAEVGAIQEFGAPALGIPPRPFFRPTIAAKQGAWVKHMTHAVRSVSTGNMSGADVLAQVGAVIAGDIQETLAKVDGPALSAETIASKGSSQPLVATGLLAASICHAVNPAGGEFSV